MGSPVLSVKVAFLSNPYDAVPSWLDIGPGGGGGPQGHGWVRGVTTKRGRERLLRASSQFQAGSAVVKIDNRDRRFDPTNTSSPAYPYIQPEKLIQVGATWASVYYPIWTGAIDDWPQTWPGMNEGEVPVVATDLFKHLALARLLSAGYQNQVLTDLPRAYYRCGDPVGSSVALDSSGFQYHAAVNSFVALGGTGAMPANVGTSATLNGGTGGTPSGQILIPPGPFTTVGTGITLECWIKTTGVAGDNIIAYPTTSNINVLRLTAAGQVQIVNSVVLTGTRVINDGLWHHVACVMQTASQLRIFVDGVLDVSVGGPPTAFPNLPGAIGSLGNAGLWNADTIDVQDVALYNYALSSAQILKHFQLAAWPAQSTGQFVGQLLDTIGFPSSQRRIDNGYTLCQADFQSEVQNKILDQMQKVEQTEQGQLFIGADGFVNFQDRYHRYRSPSANSIGTFGDAPTTVGPAVSLIQGAPVNFAGASSSPVTNNLYCTAGSGLLLGVFYEGGSFVYPVNPSVTGGAGGWVKIGSSVFGGAFGQIDWWWAPTCLPGPNTIAINPDPLSLGRIANIGTWLFEIGGAGTPVAGMAVSGSGGTNVTYTPMTVTLPGSLALIAGNNGQGNAFTPATGIPNFLNGPTNGGVMECGITYGIVSANTPAGTGWTMPSSVAWCTSGIVIPPRVTPAELPYVMGGVTLNFDRMELFNQILVTRRNGALQTASNPASIALYTTRTMQLSDLLMADDADALYAGEWILADTAYPQFRVGDLVLNPNADDRLWPLVLGAEIGNVITVNKHNIPGGGPTISLLCRIEGIEHLIDPPKDWITKWHVSLVGTGNWGIYNDPVMGLYNGQCRWGW